VTLSTQPTPLSGDKPPAVPQDRPAVGLYSSAQDAVKSLKDDYFYWTGKVTESSFALSLAVIGANWAVFGSVNKLLSNFWAELSVATVILNLVISLLGNAWLGRLLRQRITYAEQDPKRWQAEFIKNQGKSTPWPSTQDIDTWAGGFRLAKIWLPALGGGFFLLALVIPPKAPKTEPRSALSTSPTPAALSARPPTVTSTPTETAAATRTATAAATVTAAASPTTAAMPSATTTPTARATSVPKPRGTAAPQP
jgi:hypothetical protein